MVILVIIINISIVIVLCAMKTQEETKKSNEEVNKPDEEMNIPNEKINKNSSGFLTGCLIGCLIPIVLGFMLILGLGFLFEDVGYDYVWGTEVSPKGTYTAYVVVSDQGALGADVHVYVEETEEAEDYKNYYGGKSVYWDSVPNYPHIEWESENCMIINYERIEIE